MPDKKASKSKRPSADIPAMPEDLFSGETPAVPSMPEAASAPTVTVTVSNPAPSAAAVDYGLMDSLRSGQAAVTDATQKFIQKLGEYLSAALDDATSLEVRTYVSEDIGAVTYEKGAFGGSAQLRAMTRVNIDGDSLVCVPHSAGELDTAVWAVHMDMLKQAQESRAELLKTIVSAASGLATIFTPKP
jgi:hypothetical protein